MAALPTDSPTVQAIYAAYKAKREKPRRYLGASQIGKPCARALWYDFRWCGSEEFDGRMLRLFERGNIEEPRVIGELRDIGCEVHAVDETTGQQFAVNAVAGHFSGHMDGVVLGLPEAPKTWHLLEVKTHNAKSYKTLTAKRVKEHKPEHFAQMQAYMHLAGLTRGLYLACNKDTDELYAERIDYSKEDAEAILERAKSIVTAKTPPPKIGGPADFACKWCPHHARCHGSLDGPAVPCRVTCRSCLHATPDMTSDGGRWHCDRFNRHLADQEQEAACPSHLFVPDLVAFAAVTDAEIEDEWVGYKSGAAEFRNIKEGSKSKRGAYTSRELATMPRAAISLPILDEARQILGGTFVEGDIPF